MFALCEWCGLHFNSEYDIHVYPIIHEANVYMHDLNIPTIELYSVFHILQELGA